jgi:hypothetical protein
MATLSPGFQTVPEFIPDEKEHRRKLARAVNQNMQGKMNAFIDFTLTASVGSSTLIDPRIGYYSTLLFMPMTAHAAAELTSLYVPQATMQSGQAVIQHANNANADKTFRVLIIG